MREPKRISTIVARLTKVWQEHPDMRLGQLLVGAYQKRTDGVDIFHVEDEALIELVEEMFKE